MAIERWSNRVLLVRLADDPQFTDALDAVEHHTAPAAAGGGHDSRARDARVHRTGDAAGIAATAAATARAQGGPRWCDAVLDFTGVRSLNSTNLARLLKLRKQMIHHDARLVLCNLSTQVWGTFLVTGLDKVFHFSDDVTTSLATIQMR